MGRHKKNIIEMVDSNHVGKQISDFKRSIGHQYNPGDDIEALVAINKAVKSGSHKIILIGPDGKQHSLMVRSLFPGGSDSLNLADVDATYEDMSKKGVVPKIDKEVLLKQLSGKISAEDYLKSREYEGISEQKKAEELGLVD
jgi:hypothetical protein